MDSKEPFNQEESSDGFSIGKITVLVTLGAFGFLSWHFSGQVADTGQTQPGETPAAIGGQQEANADEEPVEDVSPPEAVVSSRPAFKRTVINPKKAQSASAALQAELKEEDSGEKAPAAREEGKPALPPGKAQLSLNGVIRIGEGDDRALLRRRKGVTGGGIWISIGEQFQGWYLRKVDLDSAVIEAGPDRVELRLY